MAGNTAFPNIIEAPLPKKDKLIKVSQADYNAIYKGVVADDVFAGKADVDFAPNQEGEDEGRDEGDEPAETSRRRSRPDSKQCFPLKYASMPRCMVTSFLSCTP